MLAKKSAPKSEYGAQENHWTGRKGLLYMERNILSPQEADKRKDFWTRCLRKVPKNSTLIEFGANLGINILPLSLARPDIKVSALEISKDAYAKLSESFPSVPVFQENLIDFKSSKKWDVCLIKGVLIHIYKDDRYEKALHQLNKYAKKYVLICDHVSEDPVSIPYCGRNDLWKIRNFPVDFIERYPQWNLCDMGFFHRNTLNEHLSEGLQDVRWYLLKKRSKFSFKNIFSA